MDCNGTDDEEPDDHLDDFGEVQRIRSLVEIDLDLLQELAGDVEIESRRFCQRRAEK